MKTVIFLYFEQQYVIIELTHRPCILGTLLEDCWMQEGRDQLFWMKTVSVQCLKKWDSGSDQGCVWKKLQLSWREFICLSFLPLEEEGHGVVSFWRFFLYRLHVVLQLWLRFPKNNTSPFQKLRIIQKECNNSQYTYWAESTQCKKPTEENK